MMYRTVVLRIGFVLTAAMALSAQSALAVTPVQFNFTDAGGAAPGSAVYDAMVIAGDYWSSILSTNAPVTININVTTSSLAPHQLAYTDAVQNGYAVGSVENSIRGSANTAFAATSSAALPNLSDGAYGSNSALQVYTPGYTDSAARTGINNSTRVFDADGSANNSFIALTSANAKALGFAFAPGNLDGTITFSNDPIMDFDPTNGIGPDTADGLATAIHEIGHVLGFDSGVDTYDVTGTGGPDASANCGGVLCENSPANDQYWAYSLDLFRYSAPGQLDWTTNSASYFSVDGGVTPFMNGYFSTGAYNGDGNQASHWLNNSYDVGAHCSIPTSPSLGIMDPVTGRCEVESVTALDVAALNAIGWSTTIDVLAHPDYTMSSAAIAQEFGASPSVPEPASWAMMLAGFTFVGGSMRRRTRLIVCGLA
jgi:hypothetical protein